MKKYLLLVFFFFLFINLPLFAQKPSFRLITTEQGLPSNEVYSILQDKNGFVWIGCDAGLFRYNGITFVSYKTPTQQSKSITGLSLAPNGVLYCHNFTGQVFFVENDKMDEIEGFRESYVANIAVSKQNELWIATKDGLWYYSHVTKKCQIYTDIDKKYPREHITTPFRTISDKEGNIWLVANVMGKINAQNNYQINKTNDIINAKNQLNIYPINRKSKLTLSNYTICVYQSNVWLFGMVTGDIYQLKNGTFELMDLPVLKKNILGKKITHILTDKQGKIWVMTFTGVVVYDFKTNEVQTFLEEFSFSSFLEDKDGAIWLTTLHDGVLYIPDFQFKSWQNQPNKILKVCHDKENVYFGNTGGVVSVLNTKNNQIKTYSLPTKSDIRSLDYDFLDKKVYFNANSVLYALDNNKIATIYPNAGSVKAFVHLPQGYMFATSANNYFLEDFKKDNTKNNNDKNNSNNTGYQVINNQWGRAIIYDDINKICWIATNKGLLKVVFSEKEWLIEDIFFQDKQVLGLTKITETTNNTNKNTLFAITFEGKLYEIALETALNAPPKQITQLPDNVQAYTILANGEKLFVATNQGIFVWHLGEKLGTKTWQKIGKLEGLISEDVLSLCILEDKIWLGTSKGLQSIPLDFVFDKPFPAVFLKNIFINKKNTNIIANFLKNDVTDVYEDISMNFEESLNVNLEANCYFSGDKFRYAYRFKQTTKSDSVWNYQPANSDNIAFPSFPVGAFQLEIKVLDHQNRFSKNSIWINGVVLPPFWQTWWFFGSILMILGSIFWIFFRNRIKFLQEKQRQQLKEIQLENELKLWQQTALQSQMNPHFLFNVLNSIKTYIYENNKQKAILYLNNFADLVRKILLNSEKPQISLKEEIEMLSVYVELEAMLLEEDFSWNIIIQENILTEEIFLPSFLLQPFVENAFKHGLRHKKGLKNLNISIEMPTENQLSICIEDNGVGRKKATEINKNNKTLHQSFATKNIQKRIELLHQNKTFDIKTEIIDKINEENEPLGTKIILILDRKLY